uniref:Pepsin-I3 domain-containing protein n=1 Tax=Syphacia muris TaxID=451379 RepID=A0A0N5AIR2_9BILA
MFVLLLLGLSRIVFVAGETFRTSDNKEIVHRVGYVGPACAVVDDALFLHGTYVRNLNDTEINNFEEYQNNLTIFNKFYERYNLESSKKAATYSAPTLIQIPVLPSFCEELDDSVEVILNGCTVRDNRVFISGKLIRPLNNLERQKISAVIRDQGPSLMRHKRETDNFAKLQNDMSALIHSLLNLNSTVAQRFLPVAKMSPILSDVNTSLLDENHISEAFNQVFQAEGPKLAEELRKELRNQEPSIKTPAPLTTLPSSTFKSQAVESSSTEGPATAILKLPTTSMVRISLSLYLLPRVEGSSKTSTTGQMLSESTTEFVEPTTTVSWRAMYPWTTYQTGNSQKQNSISNLEVQLPVNGLSQLGSTLKSTNYGGSVSNYQESLQNEVPSHLQNSWISNQITGYNQMPHLNNIGTKESTLTAPVRTFIPAKTLPHEICRAHIVDAFRLWSDGNQYKKYVK